MAAKTPSPKVLASVWLQRQLDTNRGDNEESLTPEALTNMLDSRVSPDKREKVLQQIKKIKEKFDIRLRKTVDKFRGVEKKSAKAKK